MKMQLLMLQEDNDMSELEYNTSYEALVWICYDILKTLKDDERDQFKKFLTETVSSFQGTDGLRSQKDHDTRLLISQKLRAFLDGIDNDQD